MTLQTMGYLPHKSPTNDRTRPTAGPDVLSAVEAYERVLRLVKLAAVRRQHHRNMNVGRRRMQWAGRTSLER